MKKEKVKKIINLTPHPVRILGAGENGEDLVIPSDGILRVAESTKKISELRAIKEFGPPDYDDGPRELSEIEHKEFRIPIYKIEYSGLKEPPREPGTIYIVSSVAAMAAPHRDDFYIVAKPVRDNEGRIIGCKGLAKNPYHKSGDSDSNNEGRPCNCGSGLPWYKCDRASSYCG